MRKPALRRTLSAGALAIFALFWVATIAESWCTMHEGRADLTAPPAHAAHSAGAPASSDAPGHRRCNCPGDCSGSAAVTPAPRGTQEVSTALPTSRPTREPSATRAPGAPQFRLPFSTAPPVA